MTVRWTRATGFTSIQLPYENSAMTVLSWPIICTYVWPQRPEHGSPIYMTIPLVLGQSFADSSPPTFKPPSTGRGIIGNLPGSSSGTGKHYESTSTAFYRVKNTIPNISDAQVVAAFQRGPRDDDLIKKIGRLDAAGGLSAKELFTMADKYAAGNSALFQVCQYKEEAPRNHN
ncbi:hypothetical protein PR202_gn00775 [Eleusine coracana subsp. coracana]|uniref:Uncharacterized protein n=1 Tax=Eleusine coracana subsp. coracana TaxID=191504 RepID=A0AAV5G3W0_ELECO|nr:hypothetical protein PR202_gn00775 [Eleusine coracana subsp. coracana]